MKKSEILYHKNNKGANISETSHILSLAKKTSIQASPKQPLIINKEEESLLRTFIKNIPAAIAIFDENLNYIITSDRWAKETNSKIKDVIGKNHYDVVPDIPLKWRKIHQRCLAGEHLKCEEDSFKRKGGTIEWLRWEVLPWYKDKGVIGGLIMFVEHITERKALEKKMVGMIKALNRSNSELEKFAHICAHDLTEPLRTLVSLSRSLEAESKEKLGPEAQRSLENILKTVKHMNTLVNGILAYSQFGPSGLNKSFFSLQHVVNSVRMLLEKKTQDKKAFIYTDALPMVYGDMVLIARVFQNLISNALKFNESDIPIIYITAKEKKTNWLFSVEDNGIGIDPKYHKKIFELFSRLHRSSRYEGTGIGLPTSKRIIEAHGGRMWVKSAPQNGSQFFFTLPKMKSPRHT